MPFCQGLIPPVRLNFLEGKHDHLREGLATPEGGELMFLIGTFKKPSIADLEWGMGAMYSVYNVNRS